MAAQPSSQPGRTARVSASARQASEWFRNLEHFAHAARTLGPDNVQVAQQAGQLADAFAELVASRAPFSFRIAPREIWMADELVVRAAGGLQQDGASEQPLPSLLHRDGLTGISVDDAASRADTLKLLDAIARTVGSPSADDDLATRLWAPDFDGMRLEVHAGDTGAFSMPGDDPFRDDVPGGPSAAPAQADGPDLDLEPADPHEAWRALQPEAPAALAAWTASWHEERAVGWAERVERFVADLIARGDGDDVGEALTRPLAGWLGAAIQVADWDEAVWAWNALHRVDRARRWSDARVAEALGALDADTVAARLDECDREAVLRFLGLVVHLGRPAIDFLLRVLGRSARQRVRAALTTALAYTCAEDPRPLTPYLRDNRWFVARNVVYVLGQVGGETAGAMIASALGHADARVRRTAVTALGQVPRARRTAALLKHLDGQDAATLHLVLDMLTRDPDPTAVAAILERVGAPEFDSRPDLERLALIGALGEIGGDDALPELERVLLAGGWFARQSPERTAAAHAIARIGTAAALKRLQDGQRARAEAVRDACLEALHGREQSA